MPSSVRSQDVEVMAGASALRGILTVPAGASGVVLFAHGSGSGRLSPRNNFVARIIQDAGVATLLIDLLTAEEERADARTGHLRFDIDFLTRRLLAATEWLHADSRTSGLAVGYFGASTGAAAALEAAAARGDSFAVVSRGGRVDLAPRIGEVAAPTLFIVGGDDEPLIPLNRRAFAALRAEKEMVIVPGASHLFEEPGAIEEVASLAAGWFSKHAAHDAHTATQSRGER